MAATADAWWHVHFSPALVRVQEWPLSLPEPRPQVTSASPSSCQSKACPSCCSSWTPSPHTTTCRREEGRGEGGGG